MRKEKYWKNMQSKFIKSNFEDPVEFVESMGIKVTKKNENYILTW